MRDYELVLVIDSNLTALKQKSLRLKIKKIIISLKGKVKKEEEWGKKEKGSYFFLQIGLLSNSLTELEKKLKLEEGLWRYLLVKTGKEEENGAKIAK